jgi:hypothetical protein
MNRHYQALEIKVFLFQGLSPNGIIPVYLFGGQEVNFCSQKLEPNHLGWVREKNSFFLFYKRIFLEDF